MHCYGCYYRPILAHEGILLNQYQPELFPSGHFKMVLALGLSIGTPYLKVLSEITQYHVVSKLVSKDSCILFFSKLQKKYYMYDLLKSLQPFFSLKQQQHNSSHNKLWCGEAERGVFQFSVPRYHMKCSIGICIILRVLVLVMVS